MKRSFPRTSGNIHTPLANRYEYSFLSTMNSVNRTGRPSQRISSVSKIPQPRPRSLSASCSRPSLPVYHGSAQRNRSSSGPNSSRLTYSARSSNYTGRPSALNNNCAPMKDPRAISTPTFKNEVFCKLLQFLTEQKYPYAFNFKQLNSIPSAEFKRMFEFLCDLIGIRVPKNENDNKKFMPQRTDKNEEVLQNTLRTLKYAYTIPKKILNIPMQHSFSSIVAIISWMLHLAQCAVNAHEPANFNEDDNKYPADLNIILNKALEEYYSYVYEQYNEEEDNMFLHNLALDMFSLKDSMDNEIKENERLEKELKQLNDEKERRESPAETIQTRLIDSRKLSEYIHQMTGVINNDNSELQKVEDKINTKTSELKSRQSELENLKKLYEVQEFNMQDMEQLLLQLQIVSENTEKEKSKVDELKKQCYEYQMITANNRSKLETACGNFNETYKTLVESPEFCSLDSGSGSYLPDFWIHPSPNIEQHKRWNQEIKPALENAAVHIQDKIYQTDADIMNYKKSCSDTELEISERNHNFGIYESEMLQKELEHKAWKTSVDADVQELQDEQKMLNEEALLYQNRSQDSSNDLEKKLKGLQEKKKEKIQEISDLNQEASRQFSSLIATANEFMNKQRAIRAQLWNILLEE